MALTERSINLLESIQVPNTYWKRKNKAYLYWFRSLLQKIDSSIIFSNLPKGWNDDFFHLCMWALGFVCVFESKSANSNKIEIGKAGRVVFQPATVAGFDFYYQPVTATVSNPLLTQEFTIGEDCELIKLTPDYLGVLDIIDFYASKLAELSKGIDIGLLNTKMPLILSAKNSAQAETLKKVYDKIQEGESLVILKDLIDDGDEIIPAKNPFETWSNDYRATYVVHNLLEDLKLILDSFYVEIGLPVALEKKERLITSEADFSSAQSQARISTWIETLKESLAIVNAKFNISITAEVAYERENNTNRDGERS